MSKTYGEAVSSNIFGYWSPIREDFVGHVRETGLYLVGSGEPSIVIRCAPEDRGQIGEGEK